MPCSGSGSIQDTINRETGLMMARFAKHLPAEALERPVVRERIQKAVHRRLSRRHSGVEIDRIHVSFIN